MTNHLLNNHKAIMDGQGSKPTNNTHRGLWLALGSTLIVTSMILWTVSHQANATRIAPTSRSPLSQNLTLSDAISIPLQLPQISPDNSADSVAGDDAPDTEWFTVNVKNGDTLGAIFSRIGVSADQLQKIVSLNSDTASLKNLHPGESFKFKVQNLVYKHFANQNH